MTNDRLPVSLLEYKVIHEQLTSSLLWVGIRKTPESSCTRVKGPGEISFSATITYHKFSVKHKNNGEKNDEKNTIKMKKVLDSVSGPYGNRTHKYSSVC